MVERIFNCGGIMFKNDYSCDCNVIDSCTTQQLAELFKLIGDTTTCRILFSLDKNEMCVCDIANVLNMTKSAVSHQLAVLRKNNIVKCRRCGKEMYYTLDDDHINKLFEIGLEHIYHEEEK